MVILVTQMYDEVVKNSTVKQEILNFFYFICKGWTSSFKLYSLKLTNFNHFFNLDEPF